MTTLDGRRVAYQDAWARANVVGTRRHGSAGVTWAQREPVHHRDGLAAARPPAGLHLRDAGPARSPRHRAWRAGRLRRAEARRPRASACSSRITSASSPTCRWWRAGRMRRPERGGMFLLAHVTDPHFRGFAGAGPTDFLNKRALGTLNLLLNRTRKHKMQLLEELRLDMRAQAPDHLALTGDFANVALDGRVAGRAGVDRHLRRSARGDQRDPREPRRLRRDGGRAARVREAVRALHGARSAAPPGRARPTRRPADYPFVHLRDELAFVGVSSSVATGDLGAWGRIGEAQLGRLEAMLAASELAGKTRVVLIHHPPVRQKHGEERNLNDRAALAAVLARVGAELVLHGHDHQDEHAELAGPGGKRIPDHRRRLGVVRRRARAPLALQPLRDRRRPHHLGHPRSRRGRPTRSGKSAARSSI